MPNIGPVSSALRKARQIGDGDAMSSDDTSYERKSVRTIRSREASEIAKWQNDGWELVTVSQSRLRTRMTFRRVKSKARRRRVAVVGGLISLLIVSGLVAGMTNVPEKVGQVVDRITAPPDSDGDGIVDQAETSGWRTQDGAAYRTSPDIPDTDGDGLTDGDEAGGIVTSTKSANVYRGYSNPRLPDTDGDDLGDADEADSSLDPLDRDSDDDRLEDGREVKIVGSAPDLADTDGDGFDDGFEEANQKSKGLDPLSVDVKVSAKAYATDFAKGAFLGDLNREDSLAWLAGNLASGASSSIPIFGSIVGGLADVRDAIGSAIRGDWVGSGFSTVGAVPGGDVIAIPGKASKFVARNPELSVAVAATIATLSKVPEKIKISGVTKTLKNKTTWGDLKRGGASDKALLRLSKGKIDLDALAEARKRPTHVEGPATKSFPDGYAGEAWLEDLLGATVKGSDKQVRMLTRGCSGSCNLTDLRIIDVLVDGVAHESKVGYKRFDAEIVRQIRSDAHLIKSGKIEGAHWHFMASAYNDKVGADPKVLDLLDELKIPYTIHLPA